MAVRAYRWDDAGAPQLGAASSLSALLEKVLVDGYGSKAAIGWSKIKSPSGKVIAFQPPARAVSRPWFLFDDRQGTIDALVCNGAALFRFYDGCTSIADDATVTGGQACPAFVALARTACTFPYRNADSVAGIPWVILWDEAYDYFYFIAGSPEGIYNTKNAGRIGAGGSYCCVFGCPAGAVDTGAAVASMVQSSLNNHDLTLVGRFNDNRAGATTAAQFRCEQHTLPLRSFEYVSPYNMRSNLYSLLVYSGNNGAQGLSLADIYSNFQPRQFSATAGELVVSKNVMVVLNAGKVVGALGGMYFAAHGVNNIGGGAFTSFIPQGLTQRFLGVLGFLNANTAGATATLLVDGGNVGVGRQTTSEWCMFSLDSWV